MQRAQYTERGPVPQASIAAVDFTLPPLSAGQVLIKVLAAPINPSDVLTLTGGYGILPPLPAIGGNEGSGVVIELGPGVTASAVGQTVLLPVGVGTWSTHVVGEAAKLMPLPNGADPLQLAMMTVNPPTALLLLKQFVDLQPGEWVIQNAANSGVGEYLVQLAKQVAAATDRAKIRLGIDAVGGKSTDNVASCLAEGGVLVNYGMMSGEPCVVSPASFVFRDVTLRGFWLALWFRKTTPAEQIAVLGEVAKLIATGQLTARVQATYDVSQIKEAVAAAATGERDGKILIVPRS